ncbi:IS30 family transposase, partial [Gordonia sp. NPDC062954]
MANNRVPAVKRERFWVALGEGSSVAAAARVAGVSAYSGYVWMAAAGQPLPSGRARRRRATLEDRELFWAELRAGASIA